MNIAPLKTMDVRKKRLVIIVAAAVAAVIVALTGFFTWQYVSDPARQNRETATRIVEQVRKIYELPDGEPSIARLEDPAKLPKDDFYKKAQKGDYVLVYKDEKLALIYRESTKKLINVDYVEIGQKP